MKKPLLLFMANALFLLGHAQTYHPEYENEIIGWMKIYNYKGADKPIQVDEKKYSIAQLSLIDSFTNWMKASYMPKGTLGDVKKFGTLKKDSYGERYNEAVPQYWGANANSYLFLKKKDNKWAPENNLALHWTIAANEIPMTQRLIEINTSKVCLFTLPSYNEALIREQPNSQEANEKKLYDLSGYPNINKYLYHSKPNYNNNDGGMEYVFLSKNNKFPFTHVTIGEFLQYIEDAIPVKMAEEKEAVSNKATSASDKEFFTKKIDDGYIKVRATLKKLRERYKNRLNEFAYIFNTNVAMIHLQNGDEILNVDPASFRYNKCFPVYRVDPQSAALCKTDNPQWITIKWFGATMDNPRFKYMHESIVNNFNFEYVYNFFFDPEKVKGKKYQPLRSPSYAEKIVATEKSEASKKSDADPSTFFYDDFSSMPVGKSPTEWKSELSIGTAKYATIINLNGRKENWLEIKGNGNVIPSKLKKPLPKNFELSFDLAVPKDIPWGAKALELFLCTQNKLNEDDGYIKLRFRAGFYGRPGEIAVDAHFGRDYSNSKTDYPGIGFSNDKELNAVKVKLVKKDEQLQLFFDGNKIADLPKGLPANTIFNWVQFMHINSNGPTERYFITNFKISKQ